MTFGLFVSDFACCDTVNLLPKALSEEESVSIKSSLLAIFFFTVVVAADSVCESSDFSGMADVFIRSIADSITLGTFLTFFCAILFPFDGIDLRGDRELTGSAVSESAFAVEIEL